MNYLLRSIRYIEGSGGFFLVCHEISPDLSRLARIIPHKTKGLSLVYTMTLRL